MKSKLKYDDIYALILEKKKFINKIYSKNSTFIVAINLDIKDKRSYRNSNKDRLKSRFRSRRKLKPRKQGVCQNYKKYGHLMRNWTNPRKTKANSVKSTIEKVYKALILFAHSPLDNQVLDLGTSFHTISHQ